MPSYERISLAADTARTIRLRAIRGITTDNVLPDGDFWFPVGPQNYGRAGSYTWNSTRVVNLGEVAHKGGADLDTYTFDAFFPGYYHPRLCKALRREQDFIKPERACSIIERVRDSGEIVQLIVGNGDEINEKVFIPEFAWTEEAGRPLDRLFSITFKAWEPQQIKRRGGIKLAPVPRAYKLRPGEDLMDASLRIYGHVKHWKSLAQANNVKASEAIAASLVDAGDTVIDGVNQVGRNLRRPVNRTIRVPRATF